MGKREEEKPNSCLNMDVKGGCFVNKCLREPALSMCID